MLTAVFVREIKNLGMIDAADIKQIRAIEEGALVREIVDRQGLHGFVREFWDICEPGVPFIDGWYIGAICEVLTAVFVREIKNLVINVPPGAGKSTIGVVCWPAWGWTIQPSHKWMFGGYSDALGTHHANKCFNVLRSERFRAAWPEVNITGERPRLNDFSNEDGGRRMSVTPHGKATGMHANTQCVDDPIKADEVSEKELEYVSNWWRNTMSTRRDSAMTFARVIIMQRLRDNDLAGEMLKEHGYEHLMLPLEYTPNAFWDYGNSLGKLDPRTEPNESLNPIRYTPVVIEDMKKGLAVPSAIAAQLDQNPTPDTGGIIEAGWTKQEWSRKQLGDLRTMRLIQVWDFGFKGTESSHSRVHGAVWGQRRDDFFLLDEIEPRHLNYPESKRAFKEAQNRNDFWRRAKLIYIEDKANGPAIMSEFKDEVAGMVPHEPDGSKEERLIRHSDKFEAKRIWLPPREELATVEDFRNELTKFPRAKYDDRVDTTTMALDRLGGHVSRMKAALEKVFG